MCRLRVAVISLILAGHAFSEQPNSGLCSPPPPNLPGPPQSPQAATDTLLEQRYAAEPARTDYPRIVAAIERAAEAGDADAQYNAGIAFLRGIGAPIDPARALQLFDTAAGHNNARAALQLSAIYVIGADAPRDDVAAWKWTLIARTLGSDTLVEDTLEPTLSAAQLAEAGRAAAEWYRAHLSNPAIAFALAECYIDGSGVPKDEKEALRLFEAAANAGYWKAQLEVGLSYLTGRGVNADQSQAVRWFRRAAEGGDPRAEAVLAEQCRTENVTAAFAWLRLAASSGNDFAMNKLAKWDLSAEIPAYRNLPEGLHFALAAVQRDGEDPDYLHTLADAYQANGNAAKALDTARKAVDLRPDDPGLLNTLAWLDVTAPGDLRNAAEGLSLARRAVALTKENNPWYLDTLAEAEFIGGAIGDALAAEQKALALKPSPPDAFQRNLEKYQHARDDAAGK